MVRPALIRSANSRWLRNGITSSSLGSDGSLQVFDEASCIEHLAVGVGQRLNRQRAALCQVAQLVCIPVEFDLVPALHEAEHPRAARLRESHRDLAAPVSGREALGDDTRDAEMAE